MTNDEFLQDILNKVRLVLITESKAIQLIKQRFEVRTENKGETKKKDSGTSYQEKKAG